MHYVKDIKWENGMKVSDLVDRFGQVGYQSIELNKCATAIVKMKKAGAKIFLTFTSNMVTSGLRGFFAQMIKLKMAHVIVTTAGAVEEDIMKAIGEKFEIGTFNADDTELHEKGINRIGNLYLSNESYMRFEDTIMPMLKQLYDKKIRWTPSELIREIGLMLKDEDSILYQAAKNNVPVFCPAITDAGLGFHLWLFQQKYPDFVIDVVQDFKNIVLSTSHDEIKGVIALGGGVSKHHAIQATLLNGGAEYAVYITTAREHSGSVGGATTKEAKSWGKVKDDADIATAIGDATIYFPLVMMKVYEELSNEGLLDA